MEKGGRENYAVISKLFATCTGKSRTVQFKNYVIVNIVSFVLINSTQLFILWLIFLPVFLSSPRIQNPIAHQFKNPTFKNGTHTTSAPFHLVLGSKLRLCRDGRGDGDRIDGCPGFGG